MKKLYMIGGPMGVGKTTVGQILKFQLENSVYLDGDWCWDMHPFQTQITEETKNMVIDNICYILNNFIKCSSLENIIFCWVMHEQKIIDEIILRLNAKNCRIITISLTCSENYLKQRLQKDIISGHRKNQKNIIERSLSYIQLYENLNTIKIDTSQRSAEDVAKIILAI